MRKKRIYESIWTLDFEWSCFDVRMKWGWRNDMSVELLNGVELRKKILAY